MHSCSLIVTEWTNWSRNSIQNADIGNPHQIGNWISCKSGIFFWLICFGCVKPSIFLTHLQGIGDYWAMLVLHLENTEVWHLFQDFLTTISLFSWDDLKILHVVLVFSVSGQHGLDRDHLQGQQYVSWSDQCAMAGLNSPYSCFSFIQVCYCWIVSRKLQGIGGFVLRGGMPHKQHNPCFLN